MTFSPTDYVLIDAIIVSTSDQGFLTEVEMEDIKIYDYDDTVLLKEQTPSEVIPHLVGTILTKNLKYTELEEAPKRTQIPGRWNRGRLELHSSNHIEHFLFDACDFAEEAQGLIRRKQNAYQPFSRAQQRINHLKNTALNYSFVPSQVTRPQVLSTIRGIEAVLEGIQTKHPDLVLRQEGEHSMTTEELIQCLKETETDRVGLKKLVIANLEAGNQDCVDCAVVGSYSRTQLSSAVNRIVVNDAEVRLLDTDIPVQESELIDTLDHLNLFVSPKIVSVLKTAYPGTPIFCRATYYRKSEGGFEFGLTACLWAPARKWLGSYRNRIKDLKKAIESGEASQISAAKKQVEAARFYFKDISNITPNPNEITTKQIVKEFKKLEVKYNALLITQVMCA